MSEYAALIPRPCWATHQEVTDSQTLTHYRELPAWSIAGPAPVVLLDSWEIITTADGTYAHPDGPLLHIGHDAFTPDQARTLRNRITEALALLA
ncbi:hypothetical protein QYM41_14890 [Kocuria sp. CPCC 205268]|uniref:hypothetical protein n=1 Tax=Kocuria oxytropis TaxID=3058913 RepID=UPI0034D69D0F